MLLSKLKTMTVLLLGIVAFGGLLSHLQPASPPRVKQADPPINLVTEKEAGQPNAEPPVQPGPETQAVDHYGDPLPPGAVARLGTVRFRHEGEASALAFSGDGKILVANTGSGLIVWDATTGKQMYQLPVRVLGSRGGGAGLDVSPDGTTLAIVESARAANSSKISLWELRSGKQIRAIALPNAKNALFALVFGSCLRFAPDGKSLAMTYEGKFFIFDLATDKVKASFGEIRAGIYSLAYSPDGKTLAIATHNPGLQLWDIATGKMIRGIDSPKDPRRSWAGAVAFSPDGKMVAAGSWDRITLSDPVTGKELGSFEGKMQSVNGLAFTPDGKTLVSGSQNGGIGVWDVTTGKNRFTLHSHMIGRSMALSPDGTTAAIGMAGEALGLWNVATGKELFTEFQGHGSWVNCLAFSPDGKTLVSGEFYHQIRVWDTASWKPSRVVRGGAWSLSFSPDSKRLASVPRAETVDIWDMDTAKKTMVIGVPGADDVRWAMFSADGRKIITLDKKHDPDGRSTWGPHQLRQWNAATGDQETAWTIPGDMYQPVVAPDATAVFVADGTTIRLHDLRSGRDRLFRSSAKSGIRALATSPDGRVLASGDLGQDLAVRVWEVATGREIHVLTGHECAVTSAAWSPDGRLLASGDDRRSGGSDKASNTIRLWDAATAKELARFNGFNVNVTTLAFAPDGAYLAAGLNDSTILVWDVRQSARAAKLGKKQLDAKEMSGCWTNLGGDDAPKAHQAIWVLIAAAQQSVPFLRDHLKPVVATDAAKIQRWIADSDSEQFAVRQAAVKELEKLGGQAEVPIQKAIKGKASLESRRRLERVLEAVHGVPRSSTVRSLRGIMVLERIGSPEAVNVLETLAKGAPAARETHEAKASLDRLAVRARHRP